MMKTKADILRAELSALRNGFEANGRSAADSARIDAIRAELHKLARRRLVNRMRREFMYDLNGHHGQA